MFRLACSNQAGSPGFRHEALTTRVLRDLGGGLLKTPCQPYNPGPKVDVDQFGLFPLGESLVAFFNRQPRQKNNIKLNRL